MKKRMKTYGESVPERSVGNGWLRAATREKKHESSAGELSVMLYSAQGRTTAKSAMITQEL